MSKRAILMILLVSISMTGARRQEQDSTYYWKDRVDAVGRILDLDQGRFLGAAFYVEPSGSVITAAHVVIRDTVLFEHIHSREIDSLVVTHRLPHHDLAVSRQIPANTMERSGLRLGSLISPIDSVIYLGLRDDRVLFRFDAAVSAIGEYTLPGDSFGVQAIAIDAEVLAGMSGGPVLNDAGEVIAVLVGRLTNTPQGGEDSTAVLAISTDTLRAILEGGDE